MSGVDELSREELGEMSIEELADRVDPETLHDRKYKHSETDKSERPRCELCLSRRSVLLPLRSTAARAQILRDSDRGADRAASSRLDRALDHRRYSYYF